VPKYKSTGHSHLLQKFKKDRNSFKLIKTGENSLATKLANWLAPNVTWASSFPGRAILNPEPGTHCKATVEVVLSDVLLTE
jgi:hypothetical protein